MLLLGAQAIQPPLLDSVLERGVVLLVGYGFQTRSQFQTGFIRNVGLDICLRFFTLDFISQPFHIFLLIHQVLCGL